jgi:hypothetical protein
VERTGGGNTSDTARLMVDAPGFAVGWQQPLYLPNPAAGAQWSRATDGRYFERLLSVRFVFTASAVVATRFIELQLRDSNGAVVAEVPAGNGIVAGTAVQATLMARAPAFAAGSQFQVPGFLPDLMTPPGWTWGTSTTAMDAGDQFSSVVMLLQQFPNDAAEISATG